jgi:S-adenosylmethionine:tRNA ribosyltransferase-isomerase
MFAKKGMIYVINFFDLNSYNYELDEKYIRQTPIKNRSMCKLMVVDKDTKEIIHDKFKNIYSYLKAGDVLVLNDTKVIPGRIYGYKKDTNAKIELLLLNDLGDGIWQCLAKPQKRLKVNTKLYFSPDLEAEVLDIFEDGITNIKFIYEKVFINILEDIGLMPIPPYIHKKLLDNSSYQTVYAKNLGSSAAPTAGLHFTNELLDELKSKKIKILYITLHVGLGTFRPVSENDILKHKMHSERYYISETVASELNEAKRKHKRIIAVGTTSLRALEDNYTKYNSFKSTDEETNIFIYPPYKIKSIDGLITNFHLPKSTLLMLVSAFGGYDLIRNAYESAKNNNYYFFSFGDAMFISSIFKKREFNNLLKDFNKEKPYKIFDNFKIYKGNNNILLSAPHGKDHIRNNKTKSREYNTIRLVKLLHVLTNSHVMYVNKNNSLDYNYTENNLYKDEMNKYIKENNIKYVLDIHGLSNNNKCNIEIGTNNYKNINNDIEELNKIINIINSYLTNKVLVDDKFKSSTNTISKSVSNYVKAYQFEICNNYRKYNKRPKSFKKLIYTFIKIIDLLNRGL